MTGKRRAPIGARGGTPWTPGAGWVGLVVAAALSIDPGSVRGQDPRSAGPVGDDGAYLLSFPIRDDVGLCPGGGVHVGGTGEHTVWIRGRDGEECASGRAVARIRMRDGRLRALELERPRPTTLGEARAVPGSEAARAFLFLARGAVDGDVGEEAVLGAAVARDAVVWPGLLDLARSRELHRQTRKSAVFWLGQRAADASVRELGSLARADDEDREVRKAASSPSPDSREVGPGTPSWRSPALGPTRRSAGPPSSGWPVSPTPKSSPSSRRSSAEGDSPSYPS